MRISEKRHFDNLQTDNGVAVEFGASLAKYCTFGIGGSSKALAEVHSREDLASCIRYACTHNLEPLIIGNGSNVLFDDRGYHGLVIINRIDFVVQEG